MQTSFSISKIIEWRIVPRSHPSSSRMQPNQYDEDWIDLLHYLQHPDQTHQI